MQIRWANLIVAVLVIVAVVLAFQMRDELVATLSTLRAIGPSHSTDEQIKGLLVLGLILVALVGVVRVLTCRDRDS